MHALLLVGVGVWCFAIALAGGLLGLVLGNIRLPVFLAVGINPAAAAGAKDESQAGNSKAPSKPKKKVT